MPIPQLPGGGLNSLDDIKNYVIRLERELRFLMEGGLDSTNMFEVAGWRVKPDQFYAKSGNVGMSSAGVDPTSIRFWAGLADPTQAPFRVQDDGTLYSTKGFIGGWVIGAKSLSDTAGKVGFSVDSPGSAPYLRFWAGNTTPASAGFRVYDDGSVYASNLTVTGGSISVATDVTVGNKLNMNPNNYLNGIYWGGIQIYIDPAAAALHLIASGGVYANSTKIG